MLGQPISDHDVAVISMTGRFPGASTVAGFWKNLENGVESIAEITAEDIGRAGRYGILANHPDYVWRRPVLDDIRGFDAALFGFSPREAMITDPQVRIFLECAYEALDLAGYGRPGERGRVGIFAGNNISMYLQEQFNHPEVMLKVDPYEMIVGNDKDSLTTVTAYRLDLTGPAVSVQTFCSTSAVAIHMACQSLRLGECDMALAGGVCIRVPDRVGHVYTEGGMVSPDGHVRTFDANGRGGIFGDGSAVVLLKLLRRAAADRDTVLAVIRGSAMNNDGSSKFSYTAPSVTGQAAAVAAALADAEVAPRDVSYVEAHGTATELGDPIEVAALTRAFRVAELARSGSELRDRQYCAIGSVKTNVGHLDRAATVTGFIKVIEAMRHELIPQSLNYETPNPEIDFARSPFFVAGTAMPWPRQAGRPRLAGINGLGMGGTNVHLVVQEAPDPSPRPDPDRTWQVLPVSGQSEQAAADYCDLMAGHLGSDEGQRQHLADLAFTLQVGRGLFSHRRVVVADSAMAAAAAFAGSRADDASLLARRDLMKGRRSAFLFAGVGEHYDGMVAEIYRTEPAFRRYLEAGQALLSEFAAIDVITPLTGERTAGAEGLAAMMGRAPRSAVGSLRSTAIAQPAVFLAEYALAQTLVGWGIRPALVLGYSVGEYVAACLAGVLSPSDAIRLVAYRASLIDGLPDGSMLAIGRSWDELSAVVPDLADRGVDLSAVTPGQTVIGGPPDAVAELAGLLRGRRIACRQLDTTHAFHTRMLEPVADELTRWIAGHITLNAPALPYVSNVTGELATAELVTDPGYWARHMCQPVRFAEALTTALGRPDHALIEVGPGKSLGAMARSHPACDRSRWPLILATMPAAADREAGDRTLAGFLAEAWLTGIDIDWGAYHRGDHDWTPGRVPVPGYPFQRQPYWFTKDSLPDVPLPEFFADFTRYDFYSGADASRGADGPSHVSPAVSSGEPDLAALYNEYETQSPLPESRWLNVGVWRERAPRPPMAQPGRQWVVFTDAGDADSIAGPLRAELAAADRDVALVRLGAAFAAEADGYRIRPGNIEDTVELFAALKHDGRIPDRVVHLWNLTSAPAEDTIRLGLHTLVAIAHAAHEVGFGDWKLDVVTAGTFQVSGGEPLVPARSTVHGPCTILPVEYPGCAIRVVDLVHEAAVPVTHVLAELRSDPANQVVALRGGRRWTPDFEVLALAEEEEPVPEPDAAVFREGGVYLITGGLGGIGLALAERIADAYHARLVLFGRTPVPPREQWGAILADRTAKAEVRRRVEGLLALEARGVEFDVVAGDVSRVDDVRRAVRRARERFGALHGVLHAAGVPGMGMMQFKTVAEMDRVLAPKVAGTLAIAEAIGDAPLDFLVLFSSVASWTGALGQADYSAANSFLDAFARSDALPQARVVSIGWGEWTWNGWTEGLEGYEPVLRQFYTHHREVFGIPFDAGWRCLVRILGRSEPHIVVSTEDFAASVAGSRSYTIHDIQAGARQGRGDSLHPRPELSTPYVAPSTEPEARIAEIWGEWLGIDQVGILDNFFELGGNSLIGVSVIHAVRQALEVDHIPAHLLYQAPTVSALAAQATGQDGEREGEGEPGETDADERAGLRQQRLARRRATVRAGADGA